MKTQLTDIEKSELLPQIQAVLDTGKPWEEEQIHYPAYAIIDAILTIKDMARKETNEGNGFETNGWQWDWWQHFTHGENEYTLSGSGYYGGHTFQLSD